MNVEQAEAALARAIRERNQAALVARAVQKRVIYWMEIRDRADRNMMHAADMVDERERVLREARLAAEGGWSPEPTEQEQKRWASDSTDSGRE